MRGISKLKQNIVIVFLFFLFISSASAQVSEEILEKRKRLSNISQNQSNKSPSSTKGYLTTEANKPVALLLETMLGAGFIYGENVFDAQLIGPVQANGFFTSNGSNLGMSDGIIFTSGAVSSANGPNPSSNYNYTPPNGYGGPGDADLDALIPQSTHGAAGIEFDFIPQSDTIKFEYIFGSEEYPEFNDGPYNDVFAFFLSGPNPDDPNNSSANYVKKNLAIVPGTANSPVSIENINSEDNSEYYVVNQFTESNTLHPTSVGLDGFTTVLTAISKVVACEVYHIKIVVADAQDNSWDSGVFLKSNSFSSAPVEVIPVYTNNLIPTTVENCNDVELVFTLEDPVDDVITVPFSISGTATYGVDYVTEPVIADPENGSIDIPANEISTTLKLIPLEDNNTEGLETFILTYTYLAPCSQEIETSIVTIKIDDRTEVDIVPTGDVSLVCGESTILEVEASNGFPGYTYQWSNGSHVNSIEVSPLQDASYTVTVNDECNSEKEYTFDVEVERPVAEITGAHTVCSGEEIELTASGGDTYSWEHGPTTAITKVTPTSETDYTVTVTTSPGCDDSKTVTIQTNTLPDVEHNNIDGICIDVTDLELTGGSPENGSFTGGYVSGGEFNANSAYTADGIGDYPVTYTYTDENGCSNNDIFQIAITDQIVVSLEDFDDICESANEIPLSGGSPEDGVFSGLGVNENYSTFDPSVANIGNNPITYTYTSGSCSGVKTKDILVLEAPAVSFNPSSTEFCIDDANFQFNGMSPSGGVITGVGVNNGWFYPSQASGNNVMKYTIQGANGCSNADYILFKVFELPNITFSDAFPTQCTESSEYHFTEGTPSGGIYSGPSVNSNNSTFNPAIGEGNYNITYEYEEQHTSVSCSNSSSAMIDVINTPSEATSISIANSSNLSYCQNTPPTSITLKCTGPDETYYWYKTNVNGNSIGNGKSFSISAPSQTTTYLVRSESNDCGNSDPKEITITVYPKPNASFSVSNTICQADKIHIENTSSISDNSTMSYHWDYGNNDHTSTSSVPVDYQYPLAGDYNITLSLKSNHECQTIKEKAIKVFISPQTPLNLNTTENKYCDNLPPSAITLSISNTTDNFKWYRNTVTLDSLVGNTPNIEIPVPLISTNYIVRSETEHCGNSPEETILIDVYPTPDPNYSFTDDCQNVPIVFNDQSSIASGYISTWEWDYGDGQTSNEQYPTHNYSDYGTFSTQLTIKSDHECIASSTPKEITIYPEPVADFSFSNSCLGSPTLFSNSSEAFEGVIDVYNWHFNISEGSSSSFEPSFTFASLGVKAVSLEVTTDRNCSNTKTKEITVNSLPTANFNFSNPCESNIVTFLDLSLENGNTNIEWLWDFGDNGSSTDKNPIYVFDGTAEYHTVNLNVINDKGCEDSYQIENLYVNPEFSVSIQEKEFCINREELIIAKSNDPNINMDSWMWYVDGQEYSTDQEINLTFSIPQTHEIILKGILNSNGIDCESGDSFSAIVNNLPQVDFSYEVPNLDFPTQFTDETTLDDPNASIVSWAWDFKDNGTSSDQNPEHLFSIDGTYNVELYVLDDNTCEKTIPKQILVNPEPEANFIFTKVCHGETTKFVDASTTVEGTVYSYYWEFDDGSTSTEANPNHIYLNPGTYEVKLTVEEFGFDDITKQVIVYELPNPQFSWSTPCLNEAIEFTDESTNGDGNIISWDWTTSGGGTFSGQTPQYTFPNSGLFSVSLLTTDNLGCKNTINQSINIKEPPISNFEFNLNCLNSPTEFTQLAEVGNGSVITKYKWDFGDGASSILSNPTHIYNSIKSYTSELIITNADDCQDSKELIVSINPLPEPQYNIASSICQYEGVSFQNLSSFQVPISSYEWNFDEGNIVTTYNQDVFTYVFNNSGDHNIKLKAIDDFGCSNEISKVSFVNPDFALEIDANGLCNSFPTQLIGSVVDLEVVPDSWEWIFEDGTTSNDQISEYIFEQAGNHLVQIKAIKNGCEEELTKELFVNPCPTADFNYSLISLDDVVQFEDVSTTSGSIIISWSWYFDDPQSGLENNSTLQNPEHLFTHLGDFNVSLTVTDNNGCSNTITKTLTVNPRPDADFSWDSSCFETDIQFLDKSTTSQGFITEWDWDFGDPASGAFNQSSDQNPIHAYTAAGTYNVTLTVKAFGYSTIIKEIIVTQGASAEYSYNNPCQGDPVSFIDESIIGDNPIVSWHWDFSDGNTSSEQNPVHTYQHSGNYLVDLTVTDANDCVSTITHNVTIWQGPTAKFNYYSACTGSLTYFIDKTTADGAEIISWDWNFGDPGSGSDNYSTEQNPSHEYTSEGAYIVTLIAEDINGCSNEVSVTITVEPAPIADFTADAVCIGESMFFIDQSYSSGQPIISWHWEFGDGHSSTFANPIHIYNAGGKYDVLLIVETSGGCSHEIVKEVNVHYLPTANFEWTNGQACANDTTHFTDLSSPTGNATIDSWFWEFGDGSTSVAQNPSHFFENGGDYGVTLLVIDINGCQNYITQNVIVSEGPISNFVFENPDCDIVNFTSTAYDPDGLNIIGWYWDFGDPESGSDNYSTEQNPNHQYINGGAYEVKHIVINENNCDDQIIQTVDISKPEAEFSFTASCISAPVNFTDESVSTSDPVVSWDWDFKDGATSNQQNPSHIFTSGGSFLVNLTITTSSGCTSQVAHTVVVSFGPVVDFIYTNIQCTSDSIQFTDVSTGDAILSTWEWQFGDGNTSIERHPKHAYANPGNYLVKLKVTDESGCYNEKIEDLEIFLSPDANFNWDIVNCDTAFFTDYSNDNGSAIIAWTWRFDDPSSGTGNISFLQNPSHKFTGQGNYQVQLTVSNQSLCADTITREVAYDTFVMPNFEADTICYGDSTHFTDLTSTDYQSIQSWEWHFGDGTISHEQHPAHKYLMSGIYETKLIILNTMYCSDSIIKDVLVRELPIVNFAPDSSCFTQEIQFTDESISNGNDIINWKWNFGDGASSSLSNPLHSYATDGTYPVTLEIENNFGCIDSLTKNHYVNPLPIVDFTYDTACLGTITQFSNLSVSGIGIESYTWDFGDGTSSSLSAPYHFYNTAGTFEVKLIATDAMGCLDSISKTVTVYEIPVIGFEATTACLGDSTIFTDLSTTASSWNWSFGDGTSSSLSAPKHLYDNAGTYSVLLEIEDIHSCSNSLVQEVEVLPLPIVDFNWNFSACAGDTTFFQDLSQGINTDITNWHWDFGDGGTSTEQHPWHIYPVSGDMVYEVNLIITTATTCVDSLMQEVNITGAPTAAFTYSNNEDQGPCINNQFSFIDESFTESGLIQIWHWDFGDNETSTSQNPIHFYNTSGTFTVSLSVINTVGCETTISQDIDVLALPIVDFSFDSVCVGDTTHFNDSDYINVLATEEWNYSFGDGVYSTISNPKHYYITPNTYQVVLQITDTSLCRNMITYDIPVYGLPVVDFVFDTACLGLPTQFTDLTTLADHELANWEWGFGDGASSTLSNPSHIYADYTVYTTTLVVSDAWGCTDSLQKQAVVYEPPIATFSWNDHSCSPGLVYFTNESYHNQGFAIISNHWLIDDFETDTEDTQYTFPLVDVNYPVSLDIMDARGCTDTLVLDIVVRPEIEISLTADTVCFENETQLIAIIDNPDNANISSWIWYFDDGSELFTTSEDTIYHVFNTPGIFKVELQGADEYNCAASAELLVKVYALPVADYLAEPAACDDSTAFVNQSIITEGDISEWTWSFGDGNSQSIQSPNDPDIRHLYPPFLNTFETSLIVVDEYGCSDTLNKNTQRYPCIFVNFYTDTTLYCQNKAIMLIDSSIVDDNVVVMSKYWDFGDGHELTTSPEVDTVTHIYDNTGTFTITYIMSFDVQGTILSDTMRKDITVFPTPIAGLLATNVCDKEEALLVSNIEANSSIVDSWTWFFGDGEETTIINDEVSNAIYHTYPRNGTYDLQLMAVTDLGCRDTAFKEFFVNPLPEVFLVADTNVLCGPGSILFTDSSTIETGGIVLRKWEFDDGTTTTVSDPLIDTLSHHFESEYSGTQLYTIKLSVISDSACMATDSVIEMITMHELPYPEFTVFPDSVAITEIENLLVTNLSENAYYYNWVMSDTILWDTYEPNIYEEIKDTGRYSLQLHVQSAEGCWDSTESYFKVYPVLRFFMPTGFSPNGNGINETYGPVGKYFEDKSFKFVIFNRWGELMFETNNFYDQWDGYRQKDGALCPIGVYTWVIEVVDLQGNSEVFKGHVTLVL